MRNKWAMMEAWREGRKSDENTHTKRRRRPRRGAVTKTPVSLTFKAQRKAKLEHLRPLPHECARVLPRASPSPLQRIIPIWRVTSTDSSWSIPSQRCRLCSQRSCRCHAAFLLGAWVCCIKCIASTFSLVLHPVCLFMLGAARCDWRHPSLWDVDRGVPPVAGPKSGQPGSRLEPRRCRKTPRQKNG